ISRRGDSARHVPVGRGAKLPRLVGAASLRLMLRRALAASVAMVVCHAIGRADPGGAAQRPAARSLETFDPIQASPYFSDGPAAEAARQLRLQEWANAAKGFAEYVSHHPRAKDARQASFLRAYAELKAGQTADAAKHFDALVADYPLLVDYHHVWGARAQLV